MPEQMEELALSGNPWALLFLGLMACLWAPFAEELFFRRLLLRALAARWPIAAAVGVQAFLFAVMHDYRGMHLIAIFVLGIALGGLYVWRRNIITPMLLHMFQNTGATVIMGAIMLLLQFAPVLGVSGETSDAGCLVTLVDPGTAADEAGLRAGDVIVSADGMRTPDFTTLRLLLMFKRPGQELQLEVLRDGETLKLTPLLQERDDAAEPDAPPQRAGEQ